MLDNTNSLIVFLVPVKPLDASKISFTKTLSWIVQECGVSFILSDNPFKDQDEKSVAYLTKLMNSIPVEWLYEDQEEKPPEKPQEVLSEGVSKTTSISGKDTCEEMVSKATRGEGGKEAAGTVLETSGEVNVGTVLETSEEEAAGTVLDEARPEDMAFMQFTTIGEVLLIRGLSELLICLSC